MLGSDLHNLASLPMRLEGLKRVTELAGEQTITRLTVENPRQLLPPAHDAGSEMQMQNDECRIQNKDAVPERPSAFHSAFIILNSAFAPRGFCG